MKLDNIYAHTKDGSPPEYWQLLNEHLGNVSEKAAMFANDFGSSEWGLITGLLHDIGKSSNEFQGYLRDANCIDDKLTEAFRESGQRKVDHSTAGAKVAVERFGDQLGKLLAYVIAGHHGGLPNGKDNSEASSLYSRLKKMVPEFIQPNDLKIPPVPPMPLVSGFGIAFFIRMLYSCLVDADFLDTETFIDPGKNIDRQTALSLPELQTKLKQYVSKFDPGSHPINVRRAEILQSCLDAAEDEPGFFSLTVPTGGGKTISSLAFALKHAIKYGKKRIIYVIPYTSIIEQNANVFRDILGDDAVLEHHSNFDPDNETRFSKLATENWDAPLIVTTNVQFFESLFANKSSRCRKLHNIAKSVVILDEAQMLPVNLLHPCLDAMKALVEGYGTTLVLCTATQPALNKSDGFKKGLPAPREIITDPDAMYNAFKRVSVTDLGEVDDVMLATKINTHKQALCIVSNKRQAREIFELISDRDGAFHLSTMMCPVHRIETLNEIRHRLSAKESCRVISTQLIEAGVDVDFPVVYRAIAGIDSIAQAAGRCNREGILESGDIFVFTPANPKNVPPGFLRHCADIGKQVLRRHEDNVLSLDATHEYFRRLYWQSRESLDAKEISVALNRGDIKLDFPFKDVARDFTMIDSKTQSIIIPYGNKGRDLCNEIRKIHQFADHIITRKAQRYTVQVHPFVFDKLRAAGVVESFVDEKFWILTNEDIYSHDVGLIPDDPTFYKVDTLMY